VIPTHIIARASLISVLAPGACTVADEVAMAGIESSSEGSSVAPLDMDAAKECICFARCIEFNQNSEKVSFYNVDYQWTLGASETCEPTQLIRDYLYYECVNSVIHPDYAELDPDPNFRCKIVGE
jgi:hypothetical protein